jgi:hypothetical protein
MQLLRVLVFALGLAQQATSGSVEGTVIRTGTADPIAGAQVSLFQFQTPTGPTVASPKSTLTDKDGHFSFTNVAAGRYTVRVERDGYLPPRGANAQGFAVVDQADYTAFMTRYASGAPNTFLSDTINVGPGQHVTGLRYSLALAGKISGRILDPLGRLSAGATVTALRLSYQDGRPILSPVLTAPSNDRGEYRLFWLEPGDYIVRADKVLPAGPSRGFYPKADNPARAVEVPVSAGMEFTKVDVWLQPSEFLKISGTVTNIVATLQTQDPPQFYLFPKESDAVLESMQPVVNAATTAAERAAGKFELRGVRPGSYDLVATLTDRSTPPRIFVGQTTVELGVYDLTDIGVTITPGTELNGRVVRNSSSVVGNPLTVRLRPTGLPIIPSTVPLLTATVAADGTFRIPNVPDLEYSVSIAPLLQSTYVADLKQGSFSIFDVGTIRMGGRGNRDIEIALDSPGATINGRVPATPEQLAAGISVALIPDEHRRENTMLYKRMNASATGAFSFTGVGPGRYTLYAWESIPQGAEFNAEFMDRFQDDGTSLTVAPGDTSFAQIRLIQK